VLLPLRIRDVAPATPRARLVRIDLLGHAFEYLAGQAVLVGEPGAVQRRPYSIAGAPEDARTTGCLELLVGVDDDGRAGTHVPLEPGARVDVEGPFGAFTFPESPAARDFLFVAGGTGISPLRSMLRHAILGPARARHTALLYSARTPDDFAFEGEFRALAADGVIEFRQTVTRTADTAWAGPRGRIDRDALSPLVHDKDALCFVCGPIAMVDEIPRLLEEMGVARERIKIEEW
jgi:NAD(P)H-flavin reductase